MMRLALITETYAPDINGVSMTLEHWCQGLAQRGVTIDLVRPGSATPYLKGLNTWQAAGHPLPGYPDLRFGWCLPRRVKRFWAYQRPDVFYIATEGPLGLSALRYAKRHQIPVVAGFHTNFDQYLDAYSRLPLKPLAMKYLRWFHNQAHLTLTPSAEQQRALTRQGFERVKRLGRGVDTQLFTPQKRCQYFRARLGVGPEQLLVGYVGRLAKEKNLDLLLESFQAIQKDRPNARLLLVGDGPLRQQITKQFPQAICVGMQQGEALARYYANLDLFIFPSLTETYGNVVAEAMASGTPVLAYERAAAAELITHAMNGYLVSAYSDQPTRQFCTAARHLASDEHRLVVMGHLASQRMQTQSWGQINQSFYQLLHSLILPEVSHEPENAARYTTLSTD